MLSWHWTPGAGGLLAVVELPMVGEQLPRSMPSDCRPVRPLHLTCLRGKSMAPLVGLLTELPELPELPLPAFDPTVWVASRPPHPVKDSPGAPPRQTGFLAVHNQSDCRAVVAEVVRRLDAASRALGGPAFPHPEPERFFHLSVWNNRGGDPMRSIGDIQASDLG